MLEIRHDSEDIFRQGLERLLYRAIIIFRSVRLNCISCSFSLTPTSSLRWTSRGPELRYTDHKMCWSGTTRFLSCERYGIIRWQWTTSRVFCFRFSTAYKLSDLVYAILRVPSIANTACAWNAFCWGSWHTPRYENFTTERWSTGCKSVGTSFRFVSCFLRLFYAFLWWRRVRVFTSESAFARFSSSCAMLSASSSGFPSSSLMRLPNLSTSDWSSTVCMHSNTDDHLGGADLQSDNKALMARNVSLHNLSTVPFAHEQ